VRIKVVERGLSVKAAIAMKKWSGVWTMQSYLVEGHWMNGFGAIMS